MELIDVVDEKGNYTGQTMERSEVQRLKLPYWEVIMLVVNDKKQVLLQKRSSTKKFYPNKWALCSGLVVAGESIDEAAIRELEEEIGVRFSIDQLKILEENLNLTRFYYVVCNKEEDEFVIQEEELSCVKWYDIDEVIKMIKNHDESLIIKESRIYLLEKLQNLDFSKID